MANYNKSIIILFWNRTKINTLEECCSTLKLRESIALAATPSSSSYFRGLGSLPLVVIHSLLVSGQAPGGS